MKLSRRLWLSSVGLGGPTLLACGGPAEVAPKTAASSTTRPGRKADVHERVYLSSTYKIDKKYPSMRGPFSVEPLMLVETPKPELLWIVGFEATVVGADGETPMSQEFMCHSNLDFKPESYFQHFKSNASMSGRLFTLSQGQQVVSFPEGFGMPIMSTESLSIMTQVLNLNIDEPDLDVRHRVVIRFIRDADLDEPLVALYQAGAQGMKSLEDAPAQYGFASFEEDNHGPGCSVGKTAIDGSMYVDEHGRKFTGHWVVKPGREENRTLVTRYLQLQFDTTIHAIAVHLHPFAETLELNDLTAKSTVFKSKVRAVPDKIGIEHIDSLASAEGIPIFRDHDYEVVSVYNNTTQEDVDSMAVMFLYLRDVHFQHPFRKS